MDVNNEQSTKNAQNFKIVNVMFAIFFLFMFLDVNYPNIIFQLIYGAFLFLFAFTSFSFFKDLVKSFMIFGLLQTFVRKPKEKILDGSQRFLHSVFVIGGFSYFHLYTDLGTIDNFLVSFCLSFFLIATAMNIMGVALRDFGKQDTENKIK